MNLTNTQKTRYTNPTLAKSSVRIGVRFKQSDISTLKNHCVFFVDNISRLSTSKKRVFMMGCIGVSQDTPFSVTVRQSDITHHHLNWRSLVMVNLSSTEKINMTIQSIATPVANPSIFNFQSNHTVRIVLNEQGEPLFCLSDVAKVLNIQNPRQLDLDKGGVCKKIHPYRKRKSTYYVH